MTKRAKTLTDQHLSIVLDHVAATSDNPLRDYVILLLSFKAGLRVAEIAGLEWGDVTDVFGRVGRMNDAGFHTFEVPACIAKKGHGRVIPMHPALYAALCALLASALPGDRLSNRKIIKGAAYADSVTPDALRKYISRLYVQLGLDGCSSHSGRRTFITKMTRVANNHGCSLKDAQAIAGHAFLSSTESYIDVSSQQANMVRSI